METGLFEVKEAKVPRKKIEDDLMIRHKHLKRKIEALKIQRMKEAVNGMQDAPQINPNSRRIANENEKNHRPSPSKLQRTQEIIMNSRFMPKKVTLSLDSLQKLNHHKILASKVLRYEPWINGRIESPITFPSLIDPRKANNDITETNIPLPADIRQRNELLFSLRKETLSRGFHLEPEEPPTNNLSIHDRNIKWLKEKEAKIKGLKVKFDRKISEGCTFKPELTSRKSQSLNSTHRAMFVETSYTELYARKKNIQIVRKVSCCKTERTLSQETKPCSVLNSARNNPRGQHRSDSSCIGYFGLSPVSISFGYVSGYSSQMRIKARPMIDYKTLNFRD